eukprot:1136752-Rhodomonas_salina.1
MSCEGLEWVVLRAERGEGRAERGEGRGRRPSLQRQPLPRQGRCARATLPSPCPRCPRPSPLPAPVPLCPRTALCVGGRGRSGAQWWGTRALGRTGADTEEEEEEEARTGAEASRFG